jgi:hypothetical protein
VQCNKPETPRLQNILMVIRQARDQSVFRIILARMVEDSNLVRCDAMSLDESFTAFRRIVLPSSSRPSGPRFRLFGLLDPEDKGATIFRNDRHYTPNDTESHLKRPSLQQRSYENLRSRIRGYFYDGYKPANTFNA